MNNLVCYNCLPTRQINEKIVTFCYFFPCSHLQGVFTESVMDRYVELIPTELIMAITYSNCSGNSYTYYNDLPSMVGQIANLSGYEYYQGSHLEGGWSWEKHAQSQATLDMIKSDQWDVVILQEYSTRPAYDEATVCLQTVPYLGKKQPQPLQHNHTCAASRPAGVSDPGQQAGHDDPVLPHLGQTLRGADSV